MAETCPPSSDTARRGKITRTFGEVTFSSEFDSGNLDRIEAVEREDAGPLSFLLWTAPDCAGTAFQNGNSSWYYFKVVTQANFEGNTLRLTIMNLNKQLRLYQQGFSPIFKTFPGRNRWERLRGSVNVEIAESGQMLLTFDYTISDSQKRTTYFAFCFPFSYAECQQMLSRLDQQFAAGEKQESIGHPPRQPESIYYHRDLLCHSVEGRRVDLLTVSSHHGITEEEDCRLEGLFPDQAIQRAKTFTGKRVFMVSSRVHPGESPSSFVFNGFLSFILRPDDPRAQVLRKKFVFKLIPMLNPDGVARGHYRTSARGLNLNRFYLNPDRALHPSIFAARSVFLYYHSKGQEGISLAKATTDVNYCNGALSTACEVGGSKTEGLSTTNGDAENISGEPSSSTGGTDVACKDQSVPMEVKTCESVDYKSSTAESGIAFYVDLHGHAAKRGCFIYGNYFEQESDQALNMLYPKLISLNSAHFDFSASLFSEKNMYATDKNGLSKEGSGRVALHKASGHIHCYTLECNYNSGRLVNGLSAATTDSGRATPPPDESHIPHKYSIEDFEELGRGVAVAALDYFQVNPWSRLPTSDYGSLANVKQALLQHIRSARAVKGKRAGGGGTKCRVPSANDSSSGGCTKDKVLGELKVKNGRGKLVKVTGESKVSSNGPPGRTKPKSSRTTVKPALAIMSSSSASLGIKPERRLLQQNAAVSSRLSSTKLLPEMKKPKIPFRMEFLNMKKQFEDKAALLSLPNSATTSLTNQQQKVEDIALSPVHCSVSKVNECSIVDGGTDTAQQFSSPFLCDGVVASSGSSNGLSPPRVVPVSDSIERTIVARRWEAKGKLLQRRPSYPPQVSNYVTFSTIDAALMLNLLKRQSTSACSESHTASPLSCLPPPFTQHPATVRQLPFHSFVRPKASSISDLSYLNHSF